MWDHVSRPRTTTAAQHRSLISHHDSESERDADRIADEVMRMTGHLSAADIFPAEGDAQPLPDSLRASLGRIFGFDFGSIRIHSDSDAARAASAIHARAFTAGNDIVFGPREPAPATMRGRWLLFHELAHVVQQSRGAADAILQRKEFPSDTQQIHSELEAQFAREHGGFAPPGGAHGPEYEGWLVQTSYDAAVRLLQTKDPTLHGYLVQGRVGRNVVVWTFRVPIQGAVAGSPTNVEFRFVLRVEHGTTRRPTATPSSGAPQPRQRRPGRGGTAPRRPGRSGPPARRLPGPPAAEFERRREVIEMTRPTATVTLSMPLRFNSRSGPNATAELAEALYHEGIHMLLAMDRVIEGFMPGSAGLQSGKLTAFDAIRTRVSMHRNYLDLMTDLQALIGARLVRIGVRLQQATTQARTAAERVINGLLEERFAIDEQRRQFPGRPVRYVTNATIAGEYLPNELLNEGIVLEKQADTARLVRKTTAVLDLIPAP